LIAMEHKTGRGTCRLADIGSGRRSVECPTL
jgi:hypothetical protein